MDNNLKHKRTLATQASLRFTSFPSHHVKPLPGLTWEKLLWRDEGFSFVLPWTRETLTPEVLGLGQNKDLSFLPKSEESLQLEIISASLLSPDSWGKIPVEIFFYKWKNYEDFIGAETCHPTIDLLAKGRDLWKVFSLVKWKAWEWILMGGHIPNRRESLGSTPQHCSLQLWGPDHYHGSWAHLHKQTSWTFPHLPSWEEHMSIAQERQKWASHCLASLGRWPFTFDFASSQHALLPLSLCKTVGSTPMCHPTVSLPCEQEGCVCYN